jgi:outer membrane protein assembly factor BamB
MGALPETKRMPARSTTRHLLIIAALAIVSLATAASAPAAGDWPQWHGPKRDNISPDTGLLKEWPAGGPKLLWKATKLGKGFSSVTVAGGKIFSMGDGPDGSYVLALNEADGKPLWSTKTGPAGDYGGYVGTRATPTFSDGRVYTINQHGDVVCIDAAEGKLKWGHSLVKEFGGKLPGWGYAESPLVEGDLVVCTPGGAGGTLLAFDKKSGKPVWRSVAWKDTAHYVSAVPIEYGGRKQVLQMTAKSIAGVDLEDGKLLWRADRPGQTAVIPTPIFKDGLVFTTSGYKVGCSLFEVKADGKRFTATQVYANKDLDNHHGGVVLVGDHVYGTADRMLVCMELKTGKLVWKDRSVGKGATAFADGMLYVRAEGSGQVALVEATPEGYREKGMLEQPERTKQNAWPHPVITGGRLYLRDQDNLFCYDVKMP